MHRTNVGRFSVTPTAGGSNTGESRTPPRRPSNRRKGKAITGFDKLIAENAILIISTSECCMCASVKSLLGSLGVNPVIFKVDEEEKTSVLIKLIKMNEGNFLATMDNNDLGAILAGLQMINRSMESLFVSVIPVEIGFRVHQFYSGFEDLVFCSYNQSIEISVGVLSLSISKSESSQRGSFRNPKVRLP
ncbi:hypothetical protein BC332_33900 [Capsicum chinense]|nr:hypothetical protein BC332_33900 [Capsicum chinense]